MMAGRNRYFQPALACALLFLATLAVYWPVTRFEFINCDDHTYVSQNPHVVSGLTWQGMAWAFQAGYAANWHPLTWLSHMVDVELFGLRSGLHHLVNLLFHGANTLLLFFLLTNLTKARWRSAMVAALFALHPLHVESVAWVSERKDVLSTFFGLLAMAAYVGYVRKFRRQGPKLDSLNPKSEARNAKPEIQGSKFEVQGSHFAPQLPILHLPSSIFYLLSLCLFALSLMSKPMLVTLPFLLLLLDYWPLGRLQVQAPDTRREAVGSLLWEKLPFLVLAAGSSLITVSAQKAGHALFSVEAIPMGLRVSNALVSYVRYLGKTAWPGDLALLYPYPASWGLAAVLPAAATLGLVSFFAIRWARNRPYFAVGWFWFLGTLVPVIGLVQVGPQALADRYTYLPLVGLFLSLVWAVAELSNRWAYRTTFLTCAATVLLLLCAILSRKQLSHWHDSITLFERAVAVTTGNYLAHHNLGEALGKAGRIEEAQSHLTTALRLQPNIAETHYELGQTLLKQGRTKEAVEHYREAVRLRPNWDGVLNNLAWLLATHPSAEFRKGAEAVPLAERACQLTGGTNLALLATLAAAYAEAGRFPEAIRTQGKTCDLAAAQGQGALAASFQQRLELYRSGQAYRQR